MLTFIIGIVLLITGVLFIATFRGLILLETSVLMIIIGLVLPYLTFLLPENCSFQKSNGRILIFGLIALVVQLILAQFFYDVFNFTQWLTFYRFFERGINGYSYAFSHKIFDMFPYPPILLAFLAFGNSLSTFSGGGFFQLFFKLPFIFSNILGGYIVYKIIIFLRDDQGLAEKAFCLYVFSPLLILVTSVQGEFDSFVVTLTVLAAYCLIAKKSIWLGGLLLGVGIATKLYPIFLLPFFIIYLRRIKNAALFVILAFLPLALVSAPFLILSPQAYWNIVLNSGGGVGSFSPFSILGPELAFSTLVATIPMYVAIGILFLVRFRKYGDDLILNSLLCLLVVYVLSPVTHENYAVWMLPFAVIEISEIKHLHLVSFLPFINMLMFVGTPNNGSGLFYWSSFITGKSIAASDVFLPNPSLRLGLSPFLIFCFVLVCAYVLIANSKRKSNNARAVFG